MYLDRISAAPPETRLITRDALALQQWEAVLAEAELPEPVLAWPSRLMSSWPAWLAERWENAKASGLADQNRLLLSPRQTERLWQRVIDSSEYGPSLIGSNGVSKWARSARQALLDCGIEPTQQGGPLWQDDAAAFLSWNRSFEDLLQHNGWLDPDAVLRELQKLPSSQLGHDILLLDPAPPAPAARRLLSDWQAAGHRIETIEPEGHPGSVNALIAADPWDEMERAADWALSELQTNSKRRLAVVIPDLEARRDDVEGVFAEKLGSDACILSGNRSIGAIAIFGAAITAIELLSGRGQFNALSRWLRSPFFACDDAEHERHKTALEITFRSHPLAQQNFAAAWRQHGLKASFRQLPDTVRRLETAFDRLPKRATPTMWTATWQSCLKTLRWQGFEHGLTDSLRVAWEKAWAGFSELTPIVGLMDMDSALETFSRIVATQTAYQPLPLTGVHLVTRMSQVGPGYAGAWITGYSDDTLPESRGPNPLLPWAVQMENRMPGASPDVELDASRDELRRLRQLVPVAHFSCPARLRDQPITPGPLIQGWQTSPVKRPTEQEAQGKTLQRISARNWQQCADQAPPLTGTTIPGGTRTLDLQASCPAKAFCISRLKAEPLNTPSRGIDPRLRGILLHRVLELFLNPAAPGAGVGVIDQCIQTAFHELVLPGNASWHTQIEAEQARIQVLLARFLELEAARPAFETIAVERRTDIVIDDFHLRCRIDRVDQVSSADPVSFTEQGSTIEQFDPGGTSLTKGQLLIDYKTGQSAGGRWFEDRLGDCQLPLYAQQAADVAAIMTIRLSGSDVEYRGAGKEGFTLPARLRTFEAEEWASQVARWRMQIAGLLAEFSNGDVRIRSDALQHIRSSAVDHAGGAYAPLTRIGDRR